MPLLRRLLLVLLGVSLALAGTVGILRLRDEPRPADAVTEPCAWPVAGPALATGASTGSGAWRGGDAAISMPVPGRRSLWVFGDSFIARPGGGWAFVRNAVMVDDHRSHRMLGATDPPREFFRLPGDASARDRWLWPLHGVARGDRAWVLLAEMRRTGPPPWGFAFIRTWRADVRITDWRVLRVVPLDAPAHILWGTWLLPDAGNLYIFGVTDRPTGKGVTVARAGGPSPASPWTYWTGRRWAPGGRPAIVAQPVGAQISVVGVRGGFALLTEVGVLEGVRLQVFRARSVTGPWAGPTTIYEGLRAPGSMTYNIAAHPEYDGRGLLVGSCRSCADLDHALQHLDLMRPVFVRVRRACLALPAPAPATAPASTTAADRAR